MTFTSVISWRSRRRFVVLLSLAWSGAVFAGQGSPPAEGKAAVKVQLEGADETVPLIRQPDGSLLFLLRHHRGGTETLTPEQFAERVHREQASRGFWFRLLNITSPWGLAWVALGLAGQVIFAGRMLVQWITSEKERRSVIPVSFWWLSVLGSTMLIVYFSWRKDIVGVLGQSTGWLIYLRNLWLIRRARRGTPRNET